MYAPALKIFQTKPPFIPAPKGDWVFWRQGYKKSRLKPFLVSTGFSRQKKFVIHSYSEE